jgi:hypothetical protein
MKDKFDTMFNQVEIFKCYIAKDYECETLCTYINKIKTDNIMSDNAVNGSAM